MGFFSRINPAYKRANVMQGGTAHAQSRASSGLTGLIGSLFGSAMPAYKTAPPSTVAVPEGLGVDEDACTPGPDEIVVL